MPRLARFWYSYNPVSLFLWPLGLAFGVAVMLRRLAYRGGLLKQDKIGVPVVVIGNLSVGGTGKTPLVIRLVEVLREAGYRPGVVSRGYGGKSRVWPRRVAPDSDPNEVGDEPLLIAQRGRCPVVVDPDRVAAVRELLRYYDCDVVLSDDGLQHYRLDRDVEIAVVDGARRLGNGFCLPAGPLREPARRLRSVDFVVGNGAAREGEFLMTLVAERAVNLIDPDISCSLTAFRRDLVHAVAGIGDPSRFFTMLSARDLHVLEHPFPDHHPYVSADLDFDDDLPVLMTEKDAVKCRSWAKEWHWYVPVRTRLDPELERQLLARLAASSAAKPRSGSRSVSPNLE